MYTITEKKTHVRISVLSQNELYHKVINNER